MRAGRSDRSPPRRRRDVRAARHRERENERAGYRGEPLRRRLADEVDGRDGRRAARRGRAALARRSDRSARTEFRDATWAERRHVCVTSSPTVRSSLARALSSISRVRETTTRTCSQVSRRNRCGSADERRLVVHERRLVRPGRVIETVTGSVWENAMRTTLIEPNEMHETTFATESDLDARVVGHQ